MTSKKAATSRQGAAGQARTGRRGGGAASAAATSAAAATSQGASNEADAQGITSVMRLAESDDHMLFAMAAGMKNSDSSDMTDHNDPVFVSAGISEQVKPSIAYYKAELKRRHGFGRKVDINFEEGTWDEQRYRNELGKSGGYDKKDECFALADTGFIEGRIDALLDQACVLIPI